jgi:hypothetical protein
MKRYALLTALGIGYVSLGLAQRNTETAAPQTQSEGAKAEKSGSAKDKVTTNDTVFNPNDKTDKSTGKPKTKGSKNNPKPDSPPNPPVADPHEDPISPVNTPKAGNLPK